MRIWRAYLDAFELDANQLRPGSAPMWSGKGGQAERAVVLVHGLTDSPHYMRMIARHFERAGWSVYLPLLDGHGLSEPGMMRGVSAEGWKSNVRYALEAARSRSARVSVGGLSTGGTLATHAALSPDTLVDGALFLFAAALRVYHRLGPIDLGSVTEFLLRTPLAFPVALAEELGPGLIGENPHRYSRVPFHAASALAHLIGEVDALLAEPRNRKIARPVFAVHSECDTSASLTAVADLLSRCVGKRSALFRLLEEENVRHAEVVLDRTLRDKDGNTLETKNPRFTEMIEAMLAFAERTL